MSVTTYLHFSGRCEEALKFYEQALGAKIDAMMRYKDMPPGTDPGAGCAEADPDAIAAMADKIMHSSLHIGATQLMASDGPGSGTHEGFSLSLAPASVEEGKKLFDALQSGGGQVVMPFQQTFWALGFGMVKDPFGVNWMVNVFDPAHRPAA